MNKFITIRRSGERGSLALEQVLFIGAIVLLSGGIYAFYGRLESYFKSVNIPMPPTASSSSTVN